MKVAGQILKSILIVAILTVITQVGGLVYLVYKPVGMGIKKKTGKGMKSVLIRLSAFTAMMVLTSLVIVPPVARHFGRVPLPVISREEVPLGPANVLTILANRHYVRPELKEAILRVSQKSRSHDSELKITYLDANFPFFDHFPLLPHRSHDDGKKLDIAFLYQDAKSGKRMQGAPTFLGYGHSEMPRAGELDQAADCTGKGYWHYGLITRITPQKKRWQFDLPANKALIQLIASDPAIGKIFIEPHLKTRMGLSHLDKIRFHGCNAVRHDDHVHMQL